MNKFYCLDCEHILNRFQVHYGPTEWDTKLYCKIHGSPVVQLKKVEEQRLIDDIQTILKYDKVHNTNIIEEFM